METPLIVGLLVIAAVWSIYLLPSVFGDRREAAMHSAEEFDRFTHLMADVQKRSRNEIVPESRNTVRGRRRVVLGVLVLAAIATGAMAFFQSSLGWLLVNLFVDGLLFLYIAALAQVKQRREYRLKVTHVSEQRPDFEEPQIKVIAN
jgi:MFS family permease